MLDVLDTPLNPALPQALPGRSGWCVYVLRDFEGTTLYVGMTGNIWGRLGNHAGERKRKRDLWWDRVTSIVLLPAPSRHRALQMERTLICEMRPLYNVAGN